MAYDQVRSGPVTFSRDSIFLNFFTRQAVFRAPLASLSCQYWSERSRSSMDAVGAVGARRKYREAPTPNEAGGGTCMLRRAIIPLTCMFYCRVYASDRNCAEMVMGERQPGRRALVILYCTIAINALKCHFEHGRECQGFLDFGSW